MKKLLKSIYLILLFLLLIPFKSFGQKTEPIDSTKIKLMIAAKEIMNAASTCALITLDDKGRPRVRAMDPFSPENNFTVWFGTNSKSRKVNQIDTNYGFLIIFVHESLKGTVLLNTNLS